MSHTMHQQARSGGGSWYVCHLCAGVVRDAEGLGAHVHRLGQC